MVKLLLDIRDTVENVAMVKLEIVEDCNMRVLVDKFRALGEKSAVILIRFNYEPF